MDALNGNISLTEPLEVEEALFDSDSGSKCLLLVIISCIYVKTASMSDFLITTTFNPAQISGYTVSLSLQCTGQSITQ